MEAVPNMNDMYPMPPFMGIVANKFISNMLDQTQENVINYSTTMLLKFLEAWTMDIPEFLGWSELEDPLDLESILLNAAFHIEHETGWESKERFLNRNDEQHDWQQIKLIHISFIPQAIVMGLMIESSIRDTKAKQSTTCLLPPDISDVINYVNWNIKNTISDKLISPEILMISPFRLMELIRSWLVEKYDYLVRSKMGDSSLNLDSLLVLATRWLNTQVNLLATVLKRSSNINNIQNEKEMEVNGEADDNDLLGSLRTY
jgi:hypothetical protein